MRVGTSRRSSDLYTTIGTNLEMDPQSCRRMSNHPSLNDFFAIFCELTILSTSFKSNTTR